MGLGGWVLQQEGEELAGSTPPPRYVHPRPHVQTTQGGGGPRCEKKEKGEEKRRKGRKKGESVRRRGPEGGASREGFWLPASRGRGQVTGTLPGVGMSAPGAAHPSPHLDHVLGEGVDGHGAAQRDAQTQQPHERQHGRPAQPPARAPVAALQLPLGQQLLRAARPQSHSTAAGHTGHTGHQADTREAEPDRGAPTPNATACPSPQTGHRTGTQGCALPHPTSPASTCSHPDSSCTPTSPTRPLPPSSAS